MDRFSGIAKPLVSVRDCASWNLCTLARVQARFQVLEEGRARILLNLALDEALAWAADSPEAAVRVPDRAGGGDRGHRARGCALA